MKLHLGVIDIPYEEGGVTTGEVATFLEDEYKVMETFFEMRGDEIVKVMEDSLAGALENIMAGAPPSGDPFAEAMSKTHDLFVMFLESQQMNGMPGVPTRASLEGISRRMKDKKGSPRPSFVDTGLYMASMRAWISEVMNANG